MQSKIGDLEDKMDALSSKPQTMIQKFLEHPQIKPLFEEFQR